MLGIRQLFYLVNKNRPAVQLQFLRLIDNGAIGGKYRRKGLDLSL